MKPRSICAMGHKWMWNFALGGLPSEKFLTSVDPLLGGVREKLNGRYAASDQLAGTLTPEWAEKLGLKAGIPIPVGAFDAHWDAIGAGARTGDVVNVAAGTYAATTITRSGTASAPITFTGNGVVTALGLGTSAAAPLSLSGANYEVEVRGVGRRYASGHQLRRISLIGRAFLFRPDFCSGAHWFA